MKSKDIIHHHDLSHNEKLREINKGVYYDSRNNFAQVTYDKQDKEIHHTKNLNLDKETNYNPIKAEGSMNAEHKDDDYANDETTMNKNEKDFETVPSENERMNKKLNKRMNNVEEKKIMQKKNEINNMNNLNKIQSSQDYQTKNLFDDKIIEGFNKVHGSLIPKF